MRRSYAQQDIFVLREQSILVTRRDFHCCVLLDLIVLRDLERLYHVLQDIIKVSLDRRLVIVVLQDHIVTVVPQFLNLVQLVVTVRF